MGVKRFFAKHISALVAGALVPGFSRAKAGGTIGRKENPSAPSTLPGASKVGVTKFAGRYVQFRFEIYARKYILAVEEKE